MPTITQQRMFREGAQPKRQNARATRITTAAIVAEWADHIAAKRQEGVGWDAIAEGLALAGVRSAATGGIMTGATVSAYYSRLRRRREGEDSLPVLRDRLAALEATLVQQQAEAVQALAARDRAVEAQCAAESDRAWFKDRWHEAGRKAATAAEERDRARAEAAQIAKDRDLAVAGRNEAVEAQKALTERLEALKSQLATAARERDKARAEAAQEAQERAKAEAGRRKEALEAQKALTERLTALEGDLATVTEERSKALEAQTALKSRLEAEQTRVLLLDGRAIALDKQKNAFIIDEISNEQLNAVNRHWEVLKETVAKQATDQQKKLEYHLDIAARHVDSCDVVLRVMLCSFAADAEKNTPKGLQARNVLAASPTVQAACARLNGPKQPQP